MSKISLEPNDSGAGTFSIVSPDSNTNRTLNLPDEAGKLLSTGNDNPAEVFKQANILGTVSESGGVPTGAIIERGSNSNGEFVKYADGTMICFRPFITSSGADDRGAVFRSDPVQTVSYPASFISSPQVVFGINASNVNAFGAKCGVESDRINGFRAYGPGSGDVTDVNIALTAIGRWY